MGVVRLSPDATELAPSGFGGAGKVAAANKGVVIFGDPSQGRIYVTRREASGSVLWSTAVGNAVRGDLGPSATVARPSIDGAGNVYVGCDSCLAGEWGLARLDAETGKPTLVSRGDPKQSQGGNGYGTPVIANKTVISMVGMGDNSGGVGWLTWSATDGGRFISGRAEPVAVDEGLVYVDTSTKQLVWGSRRIDLGSLRSKDGRNLSNAVPFAVLRPASVLMRYCSTTDSPPAYMVYGIENGHDCGVFLLDPAGKVTWHFQGLAPRRNAPLVQPDRIYVVDNASRLVALRAPVDGLASGPWPVFGHDNQRSFNAEHPLE